MRYIDAYKLIAEIERLKERAQAERVLHPKTILAAKDYLLIQDYDKLLSFITSLQQEQPEVDLEKEVDKFLNETGAPYFWCNDDEQKEWCNIIARHFYELGINARKDKLPEIELDKFIDKVDTFKARYKHPESIAINGAMAFMARMFYQYPNTARQWYEQLPKATMD